MTDPLDRRAVVEQALAAIEDLQARLAASEQARTEPIAVVGIGCRFPGGVRGPESYWRLLRGGVDAVTEVPTDRWEACDYYDPDPAAPGKTATRWGGFIEDVDRFDPQFFGIAPREAARMDPQHRLFLEVAWEALEDAARPADRLAGSRTGVFLGISLSEYLQLASQRLGAEDVDAYFTPGTTPNVAAGRLSHLLGLQGPSMAVDTACSSSLVTVHLACQSLRNGESDLALAGGVNLLLVPETFVAYSKMGMMAADGRCKTFAATADGFVRGEGCGIVVLERLSDALAQGDRILAVIRGSAVNQDGPSSGLSVPNGLAQQAVVRAALDAARVSAADIGYVEAHGTGTTLGDPIEVEALDAVLGKGRPAGTPLFIGSAKTNLGHLESAAGVAGLIKTVLALHYAEIPPHLHFSEPSAHIPWREMPVAVPTERTPWPASNAPRRAGVSAFGFSGTNAHAVLEEPAAAARASGTAAARDHLSLPGVSPQLVPLSAKREESLVELAGRFAQYLGEHPHADLAAIGHTLRTGRSHFAHRLAVVAGSVEEARAALAAFATTGRSGTTPQPGPAGVIAHSTAAQRPPEACFVFNDGDPDAAAGLLDARPELRAAVEQARSYVAGATPDWAAVEPRAPGRIVSLPTYPFQRRRYWLDGAAAPMQDRGRGATHPVLRRRLRSPALAGTVFAGQVTPHGPPFLADHRVRGRVVLPAAFAADLFWAAARETVGGEATLVDVVVHEPLAVTSPRELQVVVGPRNGAASEISLYAAADVDAWTLHASGRVTAPDTEPPFALDAPDAVAARCHEEVEPAAVYEGLARRGLELGPAFQGLRRLHRGRAEALGQLGLPAALGEDAGEWRAHPVLLDAALQTFIATWPDELAAGDATYLPVAFDRLHLHRPLRGGVWCHARLRTAREETITGDLTVVDEDGSPIALLEGFAVKRVRSDVARDDDQTWRGWLYETAWEQGSSPGQPAMRRPASAAARGAAEARSERGADSSLLAGLDAVSAAYTSRALRALGWQPVAGERVDPKVLVGALGVAGDHHRLVARLLDMLADDGVLHRVDGGFRVGRLPADTDADEALAVLRSRHPEHSAVLELLGRCGPRLADVLRGACDPLELLFPGGSLSSLERLYRDSPTALAPNALAAEAVAAAAEVAGGDVAVLEIGAGTGGTTTAVLERLDPTKASYVFTDLSPAFVAKARQRLIGGPPLDAQLLDIEADPDAQGFAGRRFDVVLAANVLHATADLRRTLDHLRGLLAPGGVVVLLEGTRARRWVDLTFGLTDGWWRFTDADLRPDYPLLDEQAWTRVLADAGFAEPVAIPTGADDGAFPQALLVAGAPDGGPAGRRLRLLVVGHADGLGTDLVRCARERGGSAELVADVEGAERCLAAAAAPLTHVVYLAAAEATLDEDTPTDVLEDRARATCGGLLRLIQALATASPALASRLAVVTRGAQTADGEDPAPAPLQAALWGMVRVAALEHPEVAGPLVDLDPAGGDDEVEALLDAIADPGGEDQVALRGQHRLAARLVPGGAAAAPHAGGPERLKTRTAGVLDSLAFVPARRRAPVAGEVEIRVRAAGLNFRDVLNVMGMYPGDPAPLGGECAGEICAVGPGVDRFQVGDAVCAIAPGSLASHVTTRAELVAPIPERLSSEQGATLLSAFMTARHALHPLARLAAGEHVLIHAAAGGVGLAAVQLAQRAGAEVIATAGNDEKRAYLRDLGVSHVLDSRSLAFARQVADITAGRGADVVVNCLSGDAIDASLDALAPDGRFVELGKRGIRDAAQVAAVRPDASYFVVDLAADVDALPETVGELIREIADAAADGELTPLPVQMFPRGRAVDAFRTMARARHIGKLAVTLERDPVIRADGSYLVTGGLGGLGLLVGRWLVESGAGRVVLLGRSAPGPAARDALAAMEKAGAQVTVARADVSRAAEVRDVLADIASAGPPLRGVVHAAGVLDDGALLRQDWDRFARVLSPKLVGAWNLHRLTRNQPLDLFCLFSSASALIGGPGQANHAAANAFLDALAAYRRRLGLPGLSIGWGAWADVGSAAESEVEARIVARGVDAIDPEHGLAAFAGLLHASLGDPGVPAHAAVVAADWPEFVRRQWGGPVPPLLARIAGDSRAAAPPGAPAVPAADRSAPADAGHGGTADVARRIGEAPRAGKRPLLVEHVRSRAVRVLGLDPAEPVDPELPLSELGLDSIMAVELRNVLGADLGLERPLPATLVFDYPTIASIADYVATQLFGAPAATRDERDDATAAVSGLTDEQAEALLLEELTALEQGG